MGLLGCGLGNFSLPIARRAAQVVGVEVACALIRRARENAAANGIDNARFVSCDLAADLSTQTWVSEHFTKVLLDPPRTGALEVLPAIARDPVERVVYVACNPATLARDAGILVREHGFRLAAAGVMDMFPHTMHVESIALFLR